MINASVKPIPTLKQKDIWRFWSKVALTANPFVCWNWTSKSLQKGYGKISISPTPGNPVDIVAHRLSYFLHYHEDPIGGVILHTCDNRLCVNPNHLRLGTQKDNIHDMIEKKRHNKPKGTAHWSVKLTEKQVLEIREKRASGIAELDLAKEYNVHRSTIYGAVNGLYWKHL